MFHVPNKHRIRKGLMGSDDSIGNHGAFCIPRPRKPHQAPFHCIASEGDDQYPWEHVSVRLPDRTLTWDEMCIIKNTFWDPGDLVVQYHPPEEVYINQHALVLHLWRKSGTNDFCEMPPIEMV